MPVPRFVVGGVHVAVPYTTVAPLGLRGRVLVRRESKHRDTGPRGVALAGMAAVLALMAREADTRVQLYYRGGMTAVLAAAGYLRQRRRAGG